ncbi:MAG TPA: hypothetical protein VGI39_41950 [Polyangiaceae bacterium]
MHRLARGFGRLLLLALSAAPTACGRGVSESAPDAGTDAAGVVVCDQDLCVIASGEVCCEHANAPLCVTSCPSPLSVIACDGPEDCPGQVCCEGPFPRSHASCDDQCVPGSTIRVCHVDSDCAPGIKCCPVNPDVYPGFNWCKDDC